MTDDNRILEIFRRITVALVREEGRDLTALQLAAFLICYQRRDGQSMRTLAAELKLSTSVISYVVDRLEALGLARRRPNPADGRSVLVARTTKGDAFLRNLTKILADAPERSPR